MAEAASVMPMPWLDEPRRRALETQTAHALLLHGPGDVGQFELGLSLAKGWLCEADSMPLRERPCGVCASCRLVSARSHPDLLVLVPEALRETLGWSGGDGEEGGGEEKPGKRKPSKDIRVDEVRVAVAFALITSSRGRGKVVVVNPAERMNGIAANAFLKTLEEPAGNARFLLCSAAPDALLPTIRSRCQSVAVPAPSLPEGAGWLTAQGVGDAAVLLAACGGHPNDALALAEAGVGAAAWLALPERVASGDASALRGWPLPRVVDALLKLCHDVACLSRGASPRYFAAKVLPNRVDLASLVAWQRQLIRFARQAEHPWSAELAVERLVEQGREALHTPRSARAADRGESIHSWR